MAATPSPPPFPLDSRRNRRDCLADNYRLRVLNFANECKDQPVKVNDSYEFKELKRDDYFRPRGPDAQLLGEPMLRHANYRNTRDRIIESVERNKSLLTEWTPPVQNSFRTRQQNKEIQPSFRFSNKHTDLGALVTINPDLVTGLLEVNRAKGIETGQQQPFDRPAVQNQILRLIRRGDLPENERAQRSMSLSSRAKTPKKAYFQALVTMANEQPMRSLSTKRSSGLTTLATPNVREDVGYFQNVIKNDVSFVSRYEGEDSEITSILKRCNIIRSKSDRAASAAPQRKMYRKGTAGGQ